MSYRSPLLVRISVCCVLIAAAAVFSPAGASTEQQDCKDVIANGPYPDEQAKQDKYIDCRYRQGKGKSGGIEVSPVQTPLAAPPDTDGTSLFDTSPKMYH